MSTRQQALNLALETLSEIFKETSSTSLILRRCLTISMLMGVEKEEKWIREELEGYKQVRHLKFNELQKIVPEYRMVKVVYRSISGRIVIFPKQLSMLQDDIVLQSIGEVEDSLENGLTVLDGELLTITREVARKNAIAEVATEHVESMTLRNIVEQVRNRHLILLIVLLVNKVIRRLKQKHKRLRLS